MTILKRAASLAIGTVAFASLPAEAQQRTYANPIDIDYRYNFEQINQGVSYRTGADPAVVNHKGAYYLFETLADGYWRSIDLIHWTFVTPSMWPNGGIVAPAVASDGDRLIIEPSNSFTQPSSIYVTTSPETGKLEYLVRRFPDMPGVSDKSPQEMKPGEVPPGPWDPGLLKDDDGQWYLYWDSSNVFPIYGQKIAFEDGKLIYQTRAQPLFKLHPDQHGWERFGQDHSGLLANGQPTDPYVEGAWMNKIGGRYYLQYGAPGTEFNAYANGTYVSDKPLGPFTYAPYNPIAYKPGGFVHGAGHGSSFQDRYGNWWNTGTPWIGYNWTFERRIDLLPGKIYPDGQIGVHVAVRRFSVLCTDFKGSTIRTSCSPAGCCFRTERRRARRRPWVSSVRTGSRTKIRRTFWVASANKPGETLTVDLGKVDTVRAVQVNFADYKSGRFADAPDIYTEFTLETSPDGQHWKDVARTEPPGATGRTPISSSLRRSARASSVTSTAMSARPTSRSATFESSAMRTVALRQCLRVSRASRHADERDATIRWRRVPGAVGYNIRFGIRPDRLTLTHQLWADELGDGATLSKELRSLNKGVPYWVAVEAFNETGVSKLSPVRPIR